MGLPYRILVAKGMYHGSFCTVVITWASLHWTGFLVAVFWMVGWWRRWVLRHVFLPMVFPSVYCPRCRYLIPLVQVWGCSGGHFRDHKPRHACTYYCREGHEIGYFECPRDDCRATINLQRGVQSKLHKAEIQGNSFHYAPTEEKPSRLELLREVLPLWKVHRHPLSFPIGIDRSVFYGRLQRLLRRTLRRSLRKIVHVPEAIYGRHFVVLGKSGMGKSTWIKWLVAWVFQMDMGCTVVDPAGDLAAEVIRLVPERRKDDVLWIKVWDRECPFQFNVLEAGDDDEEANLRDDVLGALRMVSDSWGQEIEYQLSVAIDTVRTFGGSLQDVYDLFTRPSVRRRVISQLRDEELIDFWMKLDKSRRSQSTVLNKLRNIVRHPILGPMLCARRSNFDADRIIRERKIVVVDTGSMSSKVNTIAGTFIISKIRAAANRQRFKNYHERVRHFVVIDEAGDFMHPGMDLDGIFSKARKFKLSLVLATQFTDQFSEKVRKSAFTNAGVLMSFAVDKEDADQLTKRMDGVAATEIMQQSVGECVVRIHNKVVFLATEQPQTPTYDPTKHIAANMREINRPSPEGESDDDEEAMGTGGASSAWNEEEHIEVRQGVR